MWRAGRTVAIALVATSLAGGVGAQTIDTPSALRAVASNGEIVTMPDLDGLDCTGMSNALRRIDLSNYRGPDPVPEGHPDSLIFAYEDRLAAKYYLSCIVVENRLENPEDAFSFGFDTQ